LGWTLGKGKSKATMGMCGAAKKERKQDQIRRPECIFYGMHGCFFHLWKGASGELAGQRNAGRAGYMMM
jgi:hypothetical protein